MSSNEVEQLQEYMRAQQLLIDKNLASASVNIIRGGGQQNNSAENDVVAPQTQEQSDDDDLPFNPLYHERSDSSDSDDDADDGGGDGDVSAEQEWDPR